MPSFKRASFKCAFFLMLGGILTYCRNPQNPGDTTDGQRAVVIQKTAKGYQLLRNGQPYFIRGAGGYNEYERLKECGGNSIRIWDTDDAQRVLDKAQQLGLTVNLGLWVGREADGFSYYDAKAMEEQMRDLRKIILQYKDHPALLMWCVGNEWNNGATNIKVWDAVNSIAQMVHEVDPNHPTTTSVYLSTSRQLKILEERCPNIDILSLNTYGALYTISTVLAESGWKKPYLISEFGAKGYWETTITSWNAPIEQTSSQKADFIHDRYSQYVASGSPNFLGSYVFYWGQKYEATSTWFSFFDAEGRETESVGLMRQLWTNQKDTHPAPRISELVLDGKYGAENVFNREDSIHLASFSPLDQSHDSLTYRWEIVPESFEVGKGGRKFIVKERKHEAVFTLENQSVPQLSFKIPDKHGSYRLLAYAYDKHNHVATANIPFYVNAPEVK